MITSTTVDAEGSVTEAGLDSSGAVIADVPSASGMLTSSDVDNNATEHWSIEGPSTGTYGSMAIDASTGEWTYTLSNSDPDTQALDFGDSVSEFFTARVTDDNGAYSDQQITVHITGANDTPVVTSSTEAAAGSVTEAGSLDNGTIDAGSSSITGSLSAADVDTDATLTWSMDGADINGETAGTFGSISITPEGNWTYSLDNSLDATQQLEEGEFQPDSFTARVTDEHGASAFETISISVSGTNDIPSLTNQLSDTQGIVVEADPDLIISSNFDAGTDGWSFVHDASTLDWHSTGGNNGGWISGNDDYALWYFVAPQKFNGDLTSYYGGQIKWDNFGVIGDQAWIGPAPDLVIQSSTLVIGLDIVQAPLSSAWSSFSALLSDQASWLFFPNQVFSLTIQEQVAND